VTELYKAAREERAWVDLDELIAKYKGALPERTVAVNGSRLLEAFLRLNEAQRRAVISPPLLAVDLQKRETRIVDRRLYLALRSMIEDEFEDFLRRCEPESTPRPTKRASISDEVSAEEEERLKADALGPLGSSHQSEGEGEAEESEDQEEDEGEDESGDREEGEGDDESGDQEKGKEKQKRGADLVA
jgi:hypothetical protein